MRNYIISIIFILFSIKPWIHKRFFACDGDAIFFFTSLHLQCTAKIAYVATFTQVMQQGKNAERIARNSFAELFEQLVASPVHVRVGTMTFTLRAGNTVFLKNRP